MAGIKRVFIIVLDSFGIGNEPDAADFGDGKCNTLASLTTSPELHAPNLTKLGLFNIDGVGCGTPADSPIGAFARLRELSRGKDTTIGHWEIAGIVSEQPMPTYPNGFPPEVLARLSAACDGKKMLCNKPYSAFMSTAVRRARSCRESTASGALLHARMSAAIRTTSALRIVMTSPSIRRAIR